MMAERATGSCHMDEQYVWCEDCDGTGQVDEVDGPHCPVCDGNGEVEILPNEGHSHECDTGACYC